MVLHLDALPRGLWNVIASMLLHHEQNLDRRILNSLKGHKTGLKRKVVKVCCITVPDIPLSLRDALQVTSGKRPRKSIQDLVESLAQFTQLKSRMSRGGHTTATMLS